MTDQRTLTIEDVLALEVLSDVQMTPDGDRVAYVVAKGHTEGDEQMARAHIWLVEANAAREPQQFTNGPRVDQHPRWNPSGDTLAFLSDREKAGCLQVMLMPSEGGEARQLTHAPGGVQTFKWSQDGSRIAYLATDAPTEEEEKRKQDKDDAEVLDQDYKWTRLWVTSLTGGEHPITPPEYEVREFTWLGADTWAIVMSSTPTADEFVKSWPIQQIDEDGTSRLLWQGDYASMDLVSSPDGTALAWNHSGFGATGWVDEVWVKSADEQPRCVLDDLDGSLSSLRWLDDGKTLLMCAASHTTTLLLRFALHEGAPETLLQGRVITNDPSGPTSSRDGRYYACLIEDGTHPRDVWVGEIGHEPRQVSHHNARLKDVTFGATESISWAAPDGLMIDGVLVYPSGYQEGQAYPLMLQLHGGPNGYWLERFMVGWHDWAQLLAARGYAVLCPNPRGSAGRDKGFIGSNQRAWGTGDLDDVLNGVDYAVKLGLADPDKLVVGGWSYGGFLTAWAIGHTDRFKAAVVGAGVTDLLSFQAADIPSWLPGAQMLAQPWEDQEIYLRCSPISYVRNISTPTLLPHGGSDQRVRVGQGRELYAALRQRGIPTTMVVYPRESHAITEVHHQRDLLTRIGAWLDRWLGRSDEGSEDTSKHGVGESAEEAGDEHMPVPDQPLS